MTHLTKEQILKYQNRELSSDEIVNVTNHLRDCETCREIIMKTEQFRKSISSLQVQFKDENHPSYEELSNYIDSTIDPERKSAIEEHASDCEICRLQLEDLKKLQSELKVVPFQPMRVGKARKYLLAAIIALAAIAAVWLMRDLLEKSAPTIVTTPSDSIRMVDGNRTIEISKNGEILKAPGISDQQISQMETIIKSKKFLVSEDLKALNPGPGTLLGEENEKRFKLKSPVGIVVLDTRPRFQWESMPNANAYQVAVLNQDLQPVVISNQIKQQHWQPDQPLQRGKVYVWQVTAYTPKGEIVSPAPPEPEAMFKVVDEQNFQKIQKAKEAKSPRLVLATIYAESGLIDEAKSELLNLKQENPNSELVGELLKSLSQ
jgi:hypothetical protein